MGNKRKDVKEIFIAALEKKTPEEQTEFLDEACGNDEKVRMKVEELLHSHTGAGEFLKGPALGSEIVYDESALSESVGTVIGRYKLLERIGEGGMAVVYMAEQEQPIRRKVALKIIKLGMDTKQVIGRFDLERQALAMMDHPNIAKVLEAGATEGGRPYFVMELVKGVCITEYCDKNRLSTKERLDLFIQVCHAVQHAHQKGIIHRDIKPTNVLVTMHDGKAVPKVIDFGIAKATKQRLTEKTLFTRYAQMIGTPAYMSPEQAEMSELGVDTRTDIYSLGVLLYELLTGATPFSAEELRKGGYLEIQRIISKEEPPKPSTKLSTLGDTLTDVALYRRTSPESLSKLLRGDLDWIVMKALEKNRDRRYETAAEFGADVMRHLSSEPVLAAAPSVSYRLRKFIRRNRVSIITGSIVVGALIIGTLVSTIGFIQANRQRESAEANLWTSESQRKRAEDNFLMSLDAVDEMLKVAKLPLNADPRLEVTQKPLVNNPELEEVRQAILQKAQALYEKFLEKNSTDPAAWVETSKAFNRTARIHQVLGQHKQAVQAYHNAINTYEKLNDEFSNEPEFLNDLNINVLAFYYFDLCHLLMDIGRNEEAEQPYWKAMKLLEELAVDFTNVDKQWEIWADMSNALGYLRIKAGQLEEAEKIIRRGNEIAAQFVEQYPTVPRYNRSLGHTRCALGSVLTYAGRLEEAEQAYQEALIASGKAIELDPNNSNYWHIRGASHIGLSQFDKALADYTKAIELKPDAEEGIYWTRRGSLYGQLAQFEKAASDFGRAVELFPNNVRNWYYQALILLVMGDTEGYRKRCASMLEHFGQTEKGDTAFWVAWTCVVGGNEVEDMAEVIKLAGQAVESSEKNDGYLKTLGAALYRAERFDEAVQQLTDLTDAWDQGSALPTLTSPAYTWFFLAMANHRLGRLDEARKWLDKAVEQAEQEIAGNASWNRRLTLQLLRKEAESLLGLSEPSALNGNEEVPLKE